LIKSTHDTQLVRAETIMARHDDRRRNVAEELVALGSLTIVDVGHRIPERATFTKKHATGTPVLDVGIIRLAADNLLQFCKQFCAPFCHLHHCYSPHLDSRNTRMSSSVFASLAGLSQRIRLMRGKRRATPDLCRVDCCAESKATSNTSSFFTSRTGPKLATVLLRTQRSSCFSSSSVKPK